MVTSPFQTRQYGLLVPNSILCALAHTPAISNNRLEVSIEDCQLFRGLRAGKLRTLKQLRKRCLRRTRNDWLLVGLRHNNDWCI